MTQEKAFLLTVMVIDKQTILKITTPYVCGCACVWAHTCMCLLKDLCGLSGLRDQDKIAERVMAVISCAY